MATVRARLEDLMSPGVLRRVYNTAEEGPNGTPVDLREFPCALVVFGGSTDIRLNPGGSRSWTYAIDVRVLGAGANAAQVTKDLVAVVEEFLDKFDAHVQLGAGSTGTVQARTSNISPLQTLEWAGADYPGVTFRIDVTEQKLVTYAGGTAAP